MSSFGRNLSGVVESLSYANPTLTLIQSAGNSPLTATIPAGISGSGNINYVPRFIGPSQLGNSNIIDFGSAVLVGVQTIVNSGTLNQNARIFGNKIGFSRISDGAEVVYLYKNTDLGTEGTANIWGYDGIQFRTQGPESVKVVITGIGRSGFGTLSPATTVHIDSAGYSLIAGYAAGNRRVTIGIDASGEPSIQATLENGTPRQLNLNPNGGPVLIGTFVNSGYLLDVNGTARVSGSLYVSSTIASVASIVLNASGRTTNFQDLIRAINAGSDFLATIEGSSGGGRFTGSSAYASVLGTNNLTDLQFGTNNIVRFTINPTGAATFSSSVDIIGQLSIGNPVNFTGPDVNTHKVEIAIGGVTYYLLATLNP